MHRFSFISVLLVSAFVSVSCSSQTRNSNEGFAILKTLKSNYTNPNPFSGHVYVRVKNNPDSFALKKIADTVIARTTDNLGNIVIYFLDKQNRKEAIYIRSVARIFSTDTTSMFWLYKGNHRYKNANEKFKALVESKEIILPDNIVGIWCASLAEFIIFYKQGDTLKSAQTSFNGTKRDIEYPGLEQKSINGKDFIIWKFIHPYYNELRSNYYHINQFGDIEAYQPVDFLLDVYPRVDY